MVQISANPLLEPAHLAKIEDLHLLARVVVEGNFYGIHRSRRQGQGNEFFQYRSYEPGEDLKNVDWKVFAKLKDLVSKTYQESTNANLIVVLDASASMAYKGAGSPCTKFRYAQMLASCLIYLGYRQGDRIGLFGGSENSQKWISPSAGAESFKKVLYSIGGMKPEGKDLGDMAWTKFKSKLPKQATVVVISDFLEKETQLSDRLSFAHSTRYQSICLQVMDPLEEVLPEGDAIQFVELEGVEELSVSPDRIRSAYQTEMQQYLGELSTLIAGTGSEFYTLLTNQDIGFGIRQFLGMQRSVK